jgi:DNA-directed RNA polymerase subunit RPC12/RpoP
MGHDDKAEGQRVSHAPLLVYMPCPACSSAVLVSDDAQLETDPPTYRCGTCGALVELRPD